MTSLGDGSVPTKLSSETKTVEEQDAQDGKADKVKLQLLSYATGSIISQTPPLQGLRRTVINTKSIPDKMAQVLRQSEGKC